MMRRPLSLAGMGDNILGSIVMTKHKKKRNQSKKNQSAARNKARQRQMKESPQGIKPEAEKPVEELKSKETVIQEETVTPEETVVSEHTEATAPEKLIEENPEETAEETAEEAAEEMTEEAMEKAVERVAEEAAEEFSIDMAMQKIISDTIGDELALLDQKQKAKEEAQEIKKNPQTKKKQALHKQVVRKLKAKKPVKFNKNMAGLICGVLVLTAVGHGVGMYYYQDKFFKSARINGIECGNLTVDQAEKLIREKVENYTLEIQFRNDETAKIKGSDIAYEYISDGSIQKIMDNQNLFAWFIGFLDAEDHKAGEKINYDEALLKAQTDNIPAMNPDNMKAPVDAHVDYKDDQFYVAEETEGTSFSKDALFEKIKEAVSANKETLNVEELGLYDTPKVRKDEPKLSEEAKLWNTCAKVSVTYQFGDKTEVLNGLKLKDWLKFDEKGNLIEDQEFLEEKVEEYVEWLAATYNTVGKDRQIKSSSTGEMITVSGGNYGFKINQRKEKEQLLQDIKDHASITREPIYSQTGKSHEENDIGNTYVEIDLTAQHVWFYKDGELITDAPCVSGTNTMPSRRTPAGTYFLVYKSKDQVLRGEGYEAPVQYWMPFNGGIGMHDANWRGSFGGTIYEYGGSHGCINLPTQAASSIFANIDAGCPIVCFYR